MANSYLLYTGNGSTTQYSLSGIDGWISTGFLKVYFNDNANPEATNTYTFVDLTTSPKIQFNTAPANNTIIRIQRETPATVSLFRSNVVDFEDTSILTAADLDKSVQGVLHVVQEANDTGSGALPPTADGTHWNAENKRITNTSNPQDLEDVATKGYVDALTLYGGAATTPQAWTFSGDSTTTDFALSPAALSTDPAMFIVEVGGTILRPTTDYTVTSSTLSFVSAPAAGTDNIVVRNLGIARNVINEVRIGTNNTGVGNAALDSLTIGTNNTAIGANAMTNSGAAYANAVVGQNALTANLTGSWNAAVGQRSLFSNTNGNYNTALGRQALQNSAGGSENVAVGSDAGSLTAASANVATVNNSIAIGANSKFNADGETNQIVIGHNAVGAGSNTTTLGNSATTNTRIPNGNLTVVSGNLAVSSGNATISGTLGAGASTLASLGVTNNATVGGTLNVTGATTLGAVGTGAATLNSLGVTNNATVGGTLGVTGATTFTAAPSYAADPASANELARKTYVDNVKRIGASNIIKVDGAGTGIAYQTGGTTFSIVSNKFRCPAGQTWEGTRMDAIEAARTVTSSSDNGPNVGATVAYLFIRLV